MPKRRSTPGERLRATRWALGLTLRDVHTASMKLARTLRNRRFILPASRLHDFEVKNTIPSIHRLYSLAQVYGCDVTGLMGWYGVPRC
jgi:transcriptional regulator with XRE-family HTH domain